MDQDATQVCNYLADSDKGAQPGKNVIIAKEPSDKLSSYLGDQDFTSPLHSKRRQQEFIPSRLEKLGIIT